VLASPRPAPTRVVEPSRAWQRGAAAGPRAPIPGEADARGTPPSRELQPLSGGPVAGGPRQTAPDRLAGTRKWADLSVFLGMCDRPPQAVSRTVTSRNAMCGGYGVGGDGAAAAAAAAAPRRSLRPPVRRRYAILQCVYVVFVTP
jgi:hypothetical protein